MRTAALAAAGLCACALAHCATPSPDSALSTTRAELEREVPGTYPTLQAAVDAAAPGDTVIVAAGTYVESVALAEGVHLRGAGVGATIIDGQINVSGLHDARVSDLTLAHAETANGTAIVGQPTSATIERCEIHGYDTAFRLTSHPDGTGATLIANVARNNGLGIEAAPANGLTVYSSVFAFHTQGAMWLEEGPVTLVGNTLVANGTAAGDDGGQVVFIDGGGTVAENIIVASEIGVRCWDCSVTLDTNDVWGHDHDYMGIAAGPSDVSVNPGFVDFAEGDWHLETDSPLRDLGGTSGEPSVDADGLPRPQGPARELGAYEIGVTTTPLVLTEVMANPLSEGQGEFVEVHNPSAVAVDLAGMHLGDGDSVDAILGWGGGPTVLSPGGWAVILDPDGASVYDIAEDTLLLTVDDKALGNGLAINDPITLYEADGVTVVDTYGHPFDPGNGVAAQRLDPAAPDGPGAWQPSPCSASPGAPPCAPPPAAASLRITEVMANPVDGTTGEFVELWNAGDEALDLAGWVLGDGDATDTLAGVDGTTLLAPDQVAVVLDPDGVALTAVAPGALRLTVASTTALGNGLAKTDPLTIAQPDGVTVAATYAHPIATSSGVSATRLVLDAPDAPGNWGPSPCDAGASPGSLDCSIDGGPDLPTLALTEVMANLGLTPTGRPAEAAGAWDSRHRRSAG